MNTYKLLFDLFVASHVNEKSALILQLGMALHALTLCEKPTMSSVAKVSGLKEVPYAGSLQYNRLNYQQKLAVKYFNLFNTADVRAQHAEKIENFKRSLESLNFNVQYKDFDFMPLRIFALAEGFILKTGEDFRSMVFSAFKTKLKLLQDDQIISRMFKDAEPVEELSPLSRISDASNTYSASITYLALAAHKKDGMGLLLASLTQADPIVALCEVVKYHHAEMDRIRRKLEDLD